MLQGSRVLATTANFPDLPLSLSEGYSTLQDHQVLVRSFREDDVTVTVQLAPDLLGVREPLQAYVRALAITLPLSMLLAALASGITAGRLLRPLGNLEQAARQIGASGDLRRPIPGVDKRDELGSLAFTLQSAFGRLAEALERETEFTRAAAHDLRTPLTALQSRIQATLGPPPLGGGVVRPCMSSSTT